MPKSRIDSLKRPPRFYATLLALIGAFLICGGAWLIILGGSGYYGVAGLAVLASAILLFRGHREGMWLYGLMLACTAGWAIWEVGLQPWPLVARILAPAVLGIWLLMPWTRNRLNRPQSRLSARIGGFKAFAGGAAMAILLGALLHFERSEPPSDPVYQAGIGPAPGRRIPSTLTDGGDWVDYGNDRGGARFSPLAQIDTSNVHKLELAWTARLGDDASGDKTGLEVTPIKIGESLYACSGTNDIYALDAQTGRRRWRFEARATGGKHCRGVAYYRTGAAKGVCSERIVTATGDARLIALDAQTGAPCPGFGDNGQVDLLVGLSKAPRGYYMITSAPTIVRGRIVLGGAISDGQYWGEPSGVIRAFDAITGQLSWAFDMGRPDRSGLPPEGETYTPATPNSWAPMSADETLGMVYVPTGNATPDYFGGQRRPFDDRFSSAVVGIDAETGKVRWSFQTTHHDLWDYDVASQPTLIDIPMASGGIRHALVQPTKRGEIFLLDRTTGRPLADVVEKPAPQHGLAPGERLAPTQPFSDDLPSFRGPDLREADMWGITPLDQLYCRIRFRQARYEGPLTPPGLTPSIAYPGYLGGMEWGGVSIDADRLLMIVNSNRVANYNRLITREEADRRGFKSAGDDGRGAQPGSAAQEGTPYGARIQPFLSPLGVPCQAPPYGYLSAVDLVTHKLVWTRVFGTARDSGPFGIPAMLPLPMGTPNIGGSFTTRGGLTFIGASQDRYLRAYETISGKMLWQARLPVGGQATPMTYQTANGRQFVVIAAGGSNALRTGAGSTLMAYALPK